MQFQLREELRRAHGLIVSRLTIERAAGRAPGADALRGVAIEEADAERLVRELALALDREPGFGAGEADPGAEDRTAGAPLVRRSETPLARAARVFEMRQSERDALALCLAVETDARFATLVAFLNDHISRARPTIGLALALSGGEANAVEFCDRPAIRLGLLQCEGDGPLPTRTLRIAPDLLRRLVEPKAEAELATGVRLRPAERAAFASLVIGEAQRAALVGWTEAMLDGQPLDPLVLVGDEQSGRATAAHAAASVAGRDLVETAWAPEAEDRAERIAAAGREALWRDGALLVRVRTAQRDPDFQALWAALLRWRTPLALALGEDMVEAACAAAPIEPLLVPVAPLTIEQREALWRLFLTERDANDLSEDEIADLAARYEFPPGRMARALRRADAERGEQGERRPLDFAALTRACQVVGGAGVRPIAQRLPLPYTRDDLVLPQALMDEIDLAGAWMRNRRLVFERWGFGRRIVFGRGLTALFSGESGTGKTMAAQVLARELGLEVYRVDLSRVMSKYIGETEKNLSQLFDNARASGAMLFFDEADVLFGKRSEVKDAHDRYANLEISYLLQRMEEHTGTTVLATNRGGDLDEAFMRRFHFILNFPMPKASERRRIWEGMLPAEADREPSLDLDALASDYEVSGGEIRNSVLTAAFMAAGEGAPIGSRHLKRGLRRELLKSGRVLDLRQRHALDC